MVKEVVNWWLICGHNLGGGFGLRGGLVDLDVDEARARSGGSGNGLLVLIGSTVRALERRGVGGLAHEAKKVEHLLVLVELRVGGSEEGVTSEDGVGTAHEHESLSSDRELKASCRETHHGARHDNASGGDHTHHIVPGRGAALCDEAVTERGASDGHECVEGHRLRVGLKGGEGEQESNTVVFLLTETNNATAADGDACLAHVLNGVEAVIVGAGADDLGVVLTTGVDVVVVGGETCLLKLLGLVRSEHTEGGADLHAHAVDLLDHLEHAVEGLLVANLTPGRAHAEAGAASGLGAASSVEHIVELHGRRGLDKSLVVLRLGAVTTVLGASTGLDGKQSALLHLAGVEVHAVDGGGLEHQVDEGLVVDGLDLLAGPVRAHAGLNACHLQVKGLLCLDLSSQCCLLLLELLNALQQSIAVLVGYGGRGKSASTALAASILQGGAKAEQAGGRRASGGGKHGGLRGE
mmetsp:Transcript_21414/g.41994  ORF Transcript_21414/g.41994 Transcript_21414/m.41994 type:complete len:466 (-) Transcript_21414:148-1545(-)